MLGFFSQIGFNVVHQIALGVGSADSGNAFRYDSSNNQYVFNLDTGSLSAGAWQLKAILDDGTSRTVVISLH